jgi:hypothetical protein
MKKNSIALEKLHIFSPFAKQTQTRLKLLYSTVYILYCTSYFQFYIPRRYGDSATCWYSTHVSSVHNCSTLQLFNGSVPISSTTSEFSLESISSNQKSLSWHRLDYSYKLMEILNCFSWTLYGGKLKIEAWPWDAIGILSFYPYSAF